MFTPIRDIAPSIVAFALSWALLAVALPAPTVAEDACESGSPGGWTPARPDIDRTGNRVVVPRPCEPLDGSFEDFQLDGRPAWVLAHEAERASHWILAYEDGRAARLAPGAGRLTAIESSRRGAEPPMLSESEDGRLLVEPWTEDDEGGGADPIPHGRSVSTGIVGAALAGPTDRYPHGVLGDDVEAAALQIRTDRSGSRPRIVLPEHAVIEGISAIEAQFSERESGFLVTVREAEKGARLRAFGEDGVVIAESDPLGQGFRWLHQIGVGRTGPDREIEVIAVRTPHIGGVVEAYQLVGDRFERVAEIEGYSSHVIGSPNLDMALLVDADADRQLEVVVPTQDMTELAILDRTDEGFEEVMRLSLGGRLTTNVAAAIDGLGRLSLAAGTDDGRLRVFR